VSPEKRGRSEFTSAPLCSSNFAVGSLRAGNQEVGLDRLPGIGAPSGTLRSVARPGGALLYRDCGNKQGDSVLAMLDHPQRVLAIRPWPSCERAILQQEQLAFRTLMRAGSPAFWLGATAPTSRRRPPTLRTWSATSPCSRRWGRQAGDGRLTGRQSGHRAQHVGDVEAGHARTSHVMVRAALKGLRRRRGAAQRQAALLRFGATLDPHTKGFALTALLGA
jgi:hypothetical protein